MDFDTATLDAVSDTRLARLAHRWRTRAVFGDRKAMRIARALETEQRRRLRETLPIDPSETPTINSRFPIRTGLRRRWWEFWRT